MYRLRQTIAERILDVDAMLHVLVLERKHRNKAPPRLLSRVPPCSGRARAAVLDPNQAHRIVKIAAQRAGLSPAERQQLALPAGVSGRMTVAGAMLCSPQRPRRDPGDVALPTDEEKRMAGVNELAELRGEIVALETALAAAFGEIAALRASVTGGGAEAAGEAMDAMATDLEGSVLRGIVLAEAAGQAGAAAGFERRMERIAHALRHAIGFQDR